jgi:hypothetical protein
VFGHQVHQLVVEEDEGGDHDQGDHLGGREGGREGGRKGGLRGRAKRRKTGGRLTSELQNASTIFQAHVIEK